MEQEYKFVTVFNICFSSHHTVNCMFNFVFTNACLIMYTVYCSWQLCSGYRTILLHLEVFNLGITLSLS